MGIIFLIRHGQSTANRDRILQGQLDTELTIEGKEQAKSIDSRVSHDIDLIYSSNLKRARNTAEIAYPGREIIIDPRLSEMDLGILEGRNVDQLSPQEEFMWDKIKHDPKFSQHKGETGYEFIRRITSVFTEIENKIKNDWRLKIAVFTHFGVIGAIITQVLDQDRMKIPNTGILKLENHLDTWKIELM